MLNFERHFQQNKTKIFVSKRYKVNKIKLPNNFWDRRYIILGRKERSSNKVKKKQFQKYVHRLFKIT